MSSHLYSLGGGAVYRVETQFTASIAGATEDLVLSSAVTGKILYPSTLEVNCVKSNSTELIRISARWIGGNHFIRNAYIDAVYDSLFWAFPDVPSAAAGEELGIEIFHKNETGSGTPVVWVTMNYYLVDL